MKGSNGIQALDLATRKIFMNNGDTMRGFMALVRETIAAAREAFPDFSRRMAALADDVDAVTGWLVKRAGSSPDDLGAAAYAYMEMLGYCTLGWLWLRMAMAARATLDATGPDPFHTTKLATARFYFERILPAAMTLRERILCGADAVMALADAEF